MNYYNEIKNELINNEINKNSNLNLRSLLCIPFKVFTIFNSAQ